MPLLLLQGLVNFVVYMSQCWYIFLRGLLVLLYNYFAVYMSLLVYFLAGSVGFALQLTNFSEALCHAMACYNLGDVLGLPWRRLTSANMGLGISLILQLLHQSLTYKPSIIDGSKGSGFTGMLVCHLTS